MQHDNALMALEKIRQEISTLDSLVWQKEHQEAGVITNRLLGLTKDLTQALEAQDKPTVAKNATTQVVDNKKPLLELMKKYLEKSLSQSHAVHENGHEPTRQMLNQVKAHLNTEWLDESTPPSEGA